MKRLVAIVILAISVVGLVLFGSNISVADTGVPNNEITTNQTQASNSSASATITITMYTGDG